MFKLESITGRVFIGIVIGIIVGLISITLMPLFGFPPLSYFGLGTLLVFMLMGMMIGLVGIFDRHPVFDFKMTWWIRGAVIGGLFMLMYALLSYSSLEIVMRSDLVSWMGFDSPFWVILDGITYGLLISLFEDKVAGSGSKLPIK